MNNIELEKKVISVCNSLHYKKGFIAPVDVLLEIDAVDKKKYLDWKNGKVLCLEKICNKNLSKLNLILNTISKYGREKKLKPSFTYYKQNGSKNKLRFTVSNNKTLEEKYATHYVDTKKLANS